MKKLIVRMRGGLGNQLFIIAFAYSIIKKMNLKEYELVIDDREYKKYKIRKLEILELLNDKNIRLYNEEKDRSILYEITRKAYHIIQKILPSNMKIPRLLTNFGLIYSKRSALCNVPKNKDVIYIYGYFQDAVMVENIKEYLLEKINLSNETDIDKNINKIAISIRWGEDYVKQNWPICGEQYYINALEEIIKEKNKADYQILVFSDEIQKVKNHQIFKNNEILFIEDKTPIEQIKLLYECDDFIISNSSFSWWGAFLGMKDESIIISPDYWYPNHEKTKKTLLCFKKMRIRNI